MHCRHMTDTPNRQVIKPLPQTAEKKAVFYVIALL